jgi:hypothetical protein
VFTVAIALIFYAIYVVFALTGVVLLFFGVRAMLRPGPFGRARTIAGAVLLLFPAVMIGWSYLPGQN